MARNSSPIADRSLLEAALEGLEAQRGRIEEQIAQVRQLLGHNRGRTTTAALPAQPAAPSAPRRRQLSAAARKRIAAAQKKRWAEYRKQEKSGKNA